MIHKIVVSRMKEKGYSCYKMENELKENGICACTTFRNFYNGESSIGSAILQYVFKILDLDVTAIAE